MAFEEFGQLSKRRRVEDAEKLKKKIVIIVLVFILALVGVGGGILGYIHYKNQKESDGDRGGGYGSGKARGTSSDKMVTEVCAKTDYKVKCEDTVAKVVKAQEAKVVEPSGIVMASISAALNEFAEASKQASAFKFENQNDKAAYNDCKVLFEDALEELQASLGKSDQYNPELEGDLRTWLSAVVSYQETCVDGFSDGSEMKTKMKANLNAAEAYLSNSLAIIANMPSLTSKLGLGKHHERRLLLLPSRELTQKSDHKQLVPNVTVSKDGSGNFSTINQALLALPKTHQGRFYIYIKGGIYNEYITVTKKMTNISMYGDGPQKTIIVGNKNYVDKVSGFRTATFAVMGEGFIAMNMGFKNTAGPEKQQAVAVRVQADKSIFLNCRMEAYQGTLYAQTHRQFYRDCVVIGRTDFIFGDAAAIFQNCTIQVRKPMGSHRNVIIAQARACRYENTGFVLQSCRVIPADADQKPLNNTTYLGRPWKDFSRTVIMETSMDDLVLPQGWLDGIVAAGRGSQRTRLKTLYYVEYHNRGAGSNLTGRVKWPGYTNSLTDKQALAFTVTPFLQGSWIKDAGVPVNLGL